MQLTKTGNTTDFGECHKPSPGPQSLLSFLPFASLSLRYYLLCQDGLLHMRIGEMARQSQEIIKVGKERGMLVVVLT